MNTHTRIPTRNELPLVREDLRSRRPSDVFVRAATAALINHVEGMSGAYPGPEKLAAERWPGDEATLTVIRAATAPATTTTTGWAAPLAATSIADFILNMGPAWASPALLARGLQLRFDGTGNILVPAVLAAAGNVGFVGEGAPISARQMAVSGPVLSPRKFAVISSFTRETLEHSTPTVEALVRAALTESVGLALDTGLLDATAGDATRPAGLRNGIAATPATAGGGFAAIVGDLKTLVAAVGPVSGNAPILFVTNLALRLSLARELEVGYEVLSTSGLAAGVIIALASNALVSAIDPAPRFETSTHGTIHQEDSTPLAIGTPPSTIAAPTRSLYQTDTVALRLIMQVSWALRTSGGLAWIQNTSW